HIAKGVGCVNIEGKPACETDRLFEHDWVAVNPMDCDSDMQTCDLVVTIDFGFDPSVRTGKAHPKYMQQFTLENTIHDARFIFSNNKYCLYAEMDPENSRCFDPSNFYSGADTINPYVDYDGPNPPYDADPHDNTFLQQPPIESASGTADSQSMNLNLETQSLSGTSEGLTNNGMSVTGNIENPPPQSNGLDGVLSPSSDIGLLQTPSTINVQQVASNDLPASDDSWLVADGLLSDDERGAVAIPDSNTLLVGTLPLLWVA
ncbi:hypothetical protein MMC29_006434, partial [Sticta canariensis]|nr:hypothetical protein [Sticta canariensis]